jgi:hypothetical protein
MAPNSPWEVPCVEGNLRHITPGSSISEIDTAKPQQASLIKRTISKEVAVMSLRRFFVFEEVIVFKTFDFRIIK